MSKRNKKRGGNPQGDANCCEASSHSPVLRVLLLGEANFSFALALRSLLEPLESTEKGVEEQVRQELYRKRLRSVTDYFGLSPSDVELNITATCYESHPELEEKYPESNGILSRLWNFAVDVRLDLRGFGFEQRGFSFLCDFHSAALAQQVTWAAPPNPKQRS